MSRNLQLTLVVIGVAVVAILALLLLNRPADPEAAAPATPGPLPAELLVREDSHHLSTAADGEVTLVEFLDFECEACGAVYPAMEQLRADYGGRINYVVRYFPVPSHRNADLAARAAEAAAAQGKFEQMYRALFDNQRAWGEKQESQEAVFLGYARDIGLDVARFQADLNSPETAARVRKDWNDGLAVGVDGTPTFFLNGTRFTPNSYQDLTDAIDAALAE
ncbi:thioredoxin domain-containing protein [Saccharopolyspora hirsuta]|uniref:Thioredoxin domain-containing protein n=1 Tax=Saccharopolyspora hirsuta TaxID=1837 RepID=A0A5M7C3J2_SACHI|nr:thioredoxin domain-containing protein [Saccharopolyspora hirsuta]KAA5835037.1 thioredoxin domain-containing protein [Saccharopolyspora hirsuta]